MAQESSVRGYKTLLYGSFLKSDNIPVVYDSSPEAEDRLFWWILPLSSSFDLYHGEVFGGLDVFGVETPLLDLGLILFLPGHAVE